MGKETARLGRESRVLAGAIWAAGVGIMLVEMQFGMDYVVSYVSGGARTIVAWLPMISTVVLHFLGR